MPLPYLSKSGQFNSQKKAHFYTSPNPAQKESLHLLIQLSRANLHLGQQTTKINMGEIMLVEHTLKVINV